MTMAAKASAKQTEAQELPRCYEEARDELAAVVDRLEAGGLTLDESLTLWERGQALAAACETFLAGARRRVEEALAAEDLGSDAREKGAPGDAPEDEE